MLRSDETVSRPARSDYRVKASETGVNMLSSVPDSATRPHNNLSRLQVSVREFLCHPRLVGSAFPASRHLVKALLDEVEWDNKRIVIEYGPGTGPFSRAILARMPADGRLFAIDVNWRFACHLRQTIDDPRLLAVTASAASAAAILQEHGLGSADLIITGIPFSTISAVEGRQILDSSACLLQKEGILLAYQMRSTIAPMLCERFGEVRKSYVWRNIPPCHLYWARFPACVVTN
jgi:phospholipid N-methyltransferase